MSFLAGDEVLLHVCCGPDATVPWPDLQLEGLKVTGYFYGSNIHPLSEYDLRLGAVRSVSVEWGGDLIVPPYDPDIWLRRARELADEPEGGTRCQLCFRLQLEAAAAVAVARGISFMTTTLTISPHKDPEVINSIGRDVAGDAGISWIDRVWRKRDGFKRSLGECRRLGIYRQSYCGCIYSLRNRDDVGGRSNSAGEAPSCGAGVPDTQVQGCEPS